MAFPYLCPLIFAALLDKHVCDGLGLDLRYSVDFLEFGDEVRLWGMPVALPWSVVVERNGDHKLCEERVERGERGQGGLE